MAASTDMALYGSERFVAVVFCSLCTLCNGTLKYAVAGKAEHPAVCFPVLSCRPSEDALLHATLS